MEKVFSLEDHSKFLGVPPNKVGWFLASQAPQELEYEFIRYSGPLDDKSPENVWLKDGYFCGRGYCVGEEGDEFVGYRFCVRQGGSTLKPFYYTKPILKEGGDACNIDDIDEIKEDKLRENYYPLLITDQKVLRFPNHLYRADIGLFCAAQVDGLRETRFFPRENIPVETRQEAQQLLRNPNLYHSGDNKPLTKENGLGLVKYRGEKEYTFAYPDKVGGVYEEQNIETVNFDNRIGFTSCFKQKFKQYEDISPNLWDYDNWNSIKPNKHVIESIQLSHLIQERNIELQIPELGYMREGERVHVGKTIAVLLPYTINHKPVRMRYSPGNYQVSFDTPDDCACPIAIFQP